MRTFYLLCMSFWAGQLFAQLPTPADYADTWARQIALEKYDEAASTLAAWQLVSPRNEVLFRAELLTAMARGRFEEQLYMEDDVLRFLEAYRTRARFKRPAARQAVFAEDSAFFGYVPLRRTFDLQTRALAEKLLHDAPNNSVEQLWCLFYSHRFTAFYNRFDHPKYAQTLLRQRYEEVLFDGYDEPELLPVGGVFLGVRQLSNDLELLGVRPHLGGFFGVELPHHQLQFNFSTSFRIGHATHSYKTYHKDSLYTTRKAGLWELHLNGQYSLFETRKTRLYVTAGAGLNLLTSVSKTEYDIDTDEPYTTLRVLTSPSVQLGGGMDFRTSSSTLVGFRIQYVVNNFRNKGRNATPLRGNFANFQWLVHLSNPHKARRARQRIIDEMSFE